MLDHIIRPYDENDRDNCLRMLREAGWMEGKDSDGETMDAYLGDSTVMIGEVEGEAEVLAASHAGDIRYGDVDLPLSAITGVLTSRVARKLGLGSRVTAEVIAQSGASVSMLGIFDQGYYDRLGFGSMPYSRFQTIDPASLRVPVSRRIPRRISAGDAGRVHANRLARHRRHGSCSLHGVGMTRCEMLWDTGDSNFGLGYEDGQGRLTHHVWMKAKGEHGPYNVHWMAWETPEQLFELLGLLKSLSDQVHGIRMCDPPGIQLQDLLDRPFATHRMRKGGDFDSGMHSAAWQQLRILDMEACVAAMHLHGPPVTFNAVVTDPITQYLPESAQWQGVGGTWRIELGETSRAERCEDSSLPTLRTSVGAFSRLWIGAASAEALSITDDFAADADLTKALDATIRLPQPQHDWEF